MPPKRISAAQSSWPAGIRLTIQLPAMISRALATAQPIATSNEFGEEKSEMMMYGVKPVIGELRIRPTPCGSAPAVVTAPA